MKITIFTLFPKMISGFMEESIVRRAQEKGLIDIHIVNLRNYALDSYGTVDDRPYGGGAGMIMRIDVLKKALDDVTRLNKAEKKKIVLTSARGIPFRQGKAKELSLLDNVVLIAGHYEGIDERISQYVDEEISLGDFVLTGGEIATAAIADATVRLIPGVLKKDEATEEESFFEVAVEELFEAVGKHPFFRHLDLNNSTHVRLLEYPQYTRPSVFEGKKIPDILLCGDPKKIRQWRLKQAFKLTLVHRPDLLDKQENR